MTDQGTSDQRLAAELEALRRRVAELEALEAEHRQAQQALRQSEERYRLLTESTTDMVFIADRSGRLLYANQSAAAYAGRAPEELVGKTQHDLFAPDVAQTHLKRIRAVFQNGEAFYQDELLQFGSHAIWADVRLLRLCDGEGRVAAVMGIARDITERKLAEEALRQACDELERRVHERTTALAQTNQQLRAIYDGVVDGILIADAETRRFLRTNGEMCRMTGYAEGELLAMSVLDFHPPEELPWILETFEAHVQGRLHVSHDIPVRRKDGSVFYADIAAKQIIYDGRPCAIAFFRDVTERRLAQAALERERQTLQHLLQASDYERQVIAYDIHDGLAQQIAGAIMQFQVFEHLKESKPKQAAEAHQAGMTMLRQSHFEVRRLISGVRPPILDDSGIVAAIAHLVHEQQRRAGPKIEFRSAVGFHRLALILENAVYRIAQEALNNACQHSRSDRVLVQLVEDCGELELVVQDWGVGFQPESVPRGRFGLEAIRQRARLLGGWLDIDTSPGSGTRLAVRLPVVLRESEQ